MNNFERSLEVLLAGKVDLVVIGGAAMYILGSAHLTSDLGVCYGRSRENIERLVSALAPYRPTLRGTTDDLPFKFDLAAVTRGMNFALATELGPIDLLGEVAGIGQYPDALIHSNLVMVVGHQCRVLSVDGLIASKRAAGRPRDLNVIPELEALREIEILRSARAASSPDENGPSPGQNADQGRREN